MGTHNRQVKQQLLSQFSIFKFDVYLIFITNEMISFGMIVIIKTQGVDSVNLLTGISGVLFGFEILNFCTFLGMGYSCCIFLGW